jgi:hypothetical protein
MSGSEMKSKSGLKPIIIVCVSLAAVVAIIYVGYRMTCTSCGIDPFRSCSENPYEYSVEEFRPTDPALLLYSEVASLKPKMQKLKGIAIDSSDQLYVVGDGSVAVFDNTGRELLRFDVKGTPGCIAVGPDGRIYLGMEDHVEVFDQAGSPLDSWAGMGEKALFTSIAVSTSSVCVADYGNRMVWKFDNDGRLVGSIDGEDKSRGITGFIVPSPYFDVVFSSKGELWIVNPGRHKIGLYGADDKLQREWGVTSMEIGGFSGCCNPSHIAIGPDGMFFTAEKGLERVKVYDPDGNLVGVVAGPEQFERGTTGLDMAVDSRGRVVVLDPRKGIVRVFEKKDRNE